MGWIFESDRPIYTQLLEQIQMRIISGTYEPGDKLPPVRELAMEAAVNPNTMQKALAELERTGLIHAQRTTGRFVTEDQELIRACRRRLAMEQLESFLKSMKELGYTREDVMDLMQQTGETEQRKSGEAEKGETEKGEGQS